MILKLRYSFAVSVFSLITLTGCATVPHVNRPYFLPEGRVDILINQTLGCLVTNPDGNAPDPGGDQSDPGKSKLDPNGNNADLKKNNTAQGTSYSFRSTAAAVVTYSYVPDYISPQKHSLDLDKVDNLFADSDVAMTLTDDGRLSAVNSVNQGEAAAIIKSVASVAAQATGVPLKSQNLTTQKPELSPEITDDYCKNVIKYGTPANAQNQQGQNPTANTPKQQSLYTLVLTYKQSLLFPNGNTIKEVSGRNFYAFGHPIPVPLDPALTPFSTTDAPLPFPDNFNFMVVTPAQPIDIQPETTATWSGQSIDVPKMMLLKLKISGPVAGLEKTEDLWNDTFIVPTSKSVKIPLPSAPWFGKLTTSIQFASSGSGLVNKVEYNKTNGLSDLFSSSVQIANQAYQQPQNTAQKASEEQAQADLIYQQQRLITCQMSPSNCPRQ